MNFRKPGILLDETKCSSYLTLEWAASVSPGKERAPSNREQMSVHQTWKLAETIHHRVGYEQNYNIVPDSRMLFHSKYAFIHREVRERAIYSLSNVCLFTNPCVPVRATLSAERVRFQRISTKTEFCTSEDNKRTAAFDRL